MSGRALLAPVFVAALTAAGCSSPVSNLVTRGATTISQATLSADGRTVTVVILGADTPSSGHVCTGTYGLTHEITANVLTVHPWAEVNQRPDMGCALTELDCCEYKVDVTIDPPFSVTEVKAPNPSSAQFPFLRTLLVRPASLATLANLDGWRLVREESPLSPWPHWEQRYVPSDAASDGPERVNLDAALDGPVVSHDATAVVTFVTVNGEKATLNSYAETNELQLVWRVGELSLGLDAMNTEFTAGDLITLAESAASTSP
jgi:hypothetical protein